MELANRHELNCQQSELDRSQVSLASVQGPSSPLVMGRRETLCRNRRRYVGTPLLNRTTK